MKMIRIPNELKTRTASLSEEFLLEKRIVLLCDSINPYSVENLISRFLYLFGQSNKPITFFINSAGGRVIDALALHDVIRSLPLEVNTVGVGVVASMAILLLASGTKRKRFLYPNTTIHIHSPFGRTEIEGSEIEELASEELRLTKRVGNLLKEYTSGKLDLENLSKEGLLISSDDAIKDYGLADFLTNKSNVICFFKNGKQA